MPGRCGRHRGGHRIPECGWVPGRASASAWLSRWILRWPARIPKAGTSGPLVRVFPKSGRAGPLVPAATRAACVLLLLAVLAGCGPGAPRADLVFINGAEPETLDPAIITGQPEGRIVHALFEGLCAFDRHGRPGPGMAERWEISGDGTVYTFHIRGDAEWSDGTPLTAHDFVASWKRALTPSTGSQYNYMFEPVKNATAYASGAIDDFSLVGVRAEDDRTLVVTLGSPTPYFLDLCAFPTLHPVPTALIDKVGDDWVKPRHMINNGAYLLEEWRINDRIRLRKNPRYWNRDAVALETVDILPIAKDSVAFNFYESGLADLVMDKGLAPIALMDELRGRRDFHSAPFLGVYFLRFNCAAPPFDDPRVRKAFAMAVDKNVIVEKITRAGELPAGAFVPPGIEGYEGPEGLPYDPEGARALLAEAGYPGGRGFPFVRYLFNESQQNESIAVELRDMWRRELGVTVDLARQEWKVYLNSLSSLDYGIARSSWVGDYPDPNTFLDMFLTGGGNNRTGWSSTHYDTLIADAAREPDPHKRNAILRNAESHLLQTGAPIAPLYYYVGIQLYDPDKFGGIAPNVLDEHPIREIFRKDHAPAPR
jgi:oligopeptide transport system substrate-binding protein